MTLMSATSPDNRVDITQEMIEKGIDFSPRNPVPTRGSHGLQDTTAIFVRN